MYALTCYRLRPRLEGVQVTHFDQYIDWEDRSITAHGPVSFPDFDARAYVATSPPHALAWASFFGAHFGELRMPLVPSVGALLILRLDAGAAAQYFALAFGTGRYLLRGDAIERGYGLRAALNLLYPAGEDLDSDPGRVVAVDAKRPGSTPMRSRGQAARATSIDDFELNHFRDVLAAATGSPADATTWGTKVSGSDAFHCSLDGELPRAGRLCRDLDDAHRRTDYRDKFAWVDNYRPVGDLEIVGKLEKAVVRSLRERHIDALGLAPPQILDWTIVHGFRFHFERPSRLQNPQRPFLHLGDLLSRLAADGTLDTLDLRELHSKRVRAVDGGGTIVHEWPLWRCLFGELSLDGTSYVLDEGSFYEVDAGFLSALNTTILSLPSCDLALPKAGVHMIEEDYNKAAVETLGGRALLLDRQLVRCDNRTSPIEVCDILTDSPHLVHVKRGIVLGI